MTNPEAPELLSKHHAVVLHSTRDPYDMSIVEQLTPHPGPGSVMVRFFSFRVDLRLEGI